MNKNNKKESISACLVVHNEEKKIKKCLESIQGIANEIIIIHDGQCTDKTIEIAKDYTDQIFIRKFMGSAEPHRCFAYEKAKSNWILAFDADERIAPNSKEKILKLIQDKNIDAYSFTWKYTDLKGNLIKKRVTTKSKRILLRKKSMYFIGLPHFQPETYGKVKSTKIILEHQCFNEVPKLTSLIKSYLNKNQKWSKVLASHIVNLEKITTFNYPKSKIIENRKIFLFKKMPLIALFLLPLYSFMYSYFLRGF